ncbi:MAG: diaminopimelate epimerase, partial [Cyanobacteria bacterium REEB65]|nr:diaminopimelate epimerase [Cyanobacteria bacterium REEB65]
MIEQGLIRFAKWQGTGNDFVIVDLADRPSAVELTTWQGLAPELCDRHFGIGADGILLLCDASDAHFEMFVLNADGSVAEMCGNGLRCAALHRGPEHRPCAQRLKIRTGAGLRMAELMADGSVRIEMGSPQGLGLGTCKPGTPVAEVQLDDLQLTVQGLSLGNPHAVLFVDDLAGLDLARLGPAISAHPQFPQGSNAGFAQVLSRHDLRLAVWERGSGLTLACGTGACAAAVAGILEGRLDSPVRVALAGGTLTIEWQFDRPVFMTGPARRVFEGELPLAGFSRAPLACRP